MNMKWQRLLTLGLAGSLMCSPLAFANSKDSSDNMVMYVTEFQRVQQTYRSLVHNIENAQDGSEFDGHYHTMQAFLINPGANTYSNLSLCELLKQVDPAELSYFSAIIDSPDTDRSLQLCKPAIQQRINLSKALMPVTFDLNADIAAVHPIPFEERIIDPELGYVSNQGFADKEVMLSFDDGPTERNTYPILAALKQAGVKAAFFSTGRQAMQNPSITQEVLREGHVVGSHSYYHTLMMGREVNRGVMPYEFFLSEFVSGHLGVYAASKYIDPYFRFPNGCMNQTMRKNVNDLGLKIFGWNVDSFDWSFTVHKYQDAEARRQLILQSLITQLNQREHRGVILMHDIFEQSAEALPLVLNYLADNGYKVVLLKPADRDMSPTARLPVVAQALDYMQSHNLTLKEIRPPVNANGDILPPATFKPAVDFYDMFPGLERMPEGVIDPATKSCDYKKPGDTAPPVETVPSGE